LFTLYFVFLVSLRCLTSAVGMIHVTGYVGREVNVSCSYDQSYVSHEKYLCKDSCGSDDVLITTSQASKTKYSIYDDNSARIFTTTIFDLQSTDAGKYWLTRTFDDINRFNVSGQNTYKCSDESGRLQELGCHMCLCVFCRQCKASKYQKPNYINDCGDSDLLITTSNSSKNKYSIHDNKTSRIFTTTISDLHSVDAGKYWCGVTRTGKDIYTEVELKLVPGK
uniref:Immunoglobulin V-set domain-containing protein n=1 Tax=Pundamilia nyererei TaxID=303518 RepID=A0A3B4GZZ2_9CICH